MLNIISPNPPFFGRMLESCLPLLQSWLGTFSRSQGFLPTTLDNIQRSKISAPHIPIQTPHPSPTQACASGIWIPWGRQKKKKAERHSTGLKRPLHSLFGRQGLEDPWNLWRSTASCSPGRYGSVWSVWGVAGAEQRYSLQWSPCACSHRCPTSCSGEQWCYNGERRSQCRE